MPVGNRVFRQEVRAELDLHAAALRDFHRVRQRLGNVGEQRLHFLRALEVLLFAVASDATRIVQRAAFLNADARLVRFEIVALDEAHVVGGDHRQVELGCERDRTGEVRIFTVATGAFEFQIVAVAENAAPMRRVRLRGG